MAKKDSEGASSQYREYSIEHFQSPVPASPLFLLSQESTGVQAKTLAKIVISDWCPRFPGDDNITDYSHAWRSELGVKIGKISAISQSKTLIP
ncbi:MAG TPA: hypothetical protein VMW72_02395 [Sedimentisphaerales bacterium]|nr:hypothetical protein [Sedimentisphaerales bacterium]